LGYVATTASAKSHATVTLRVGLFGDFGYHDLYKQFEASHPNIDTKEDIQSYPDHHSNLAKHLATGAGADDVEASLRAYERQRSARTTPIVKRSRQLGQLASASGRWTCALRDGVIAATPARAQARQQAQVLDYELPEL
jgi:hypothetical protein